MKHDIETSGVDANWSYHWNFGQSTSVLFTNPKVKIKVIYTQAELRAVLKRSDKENKFVPVPRDVMVCALNTLDGQDVLAA